MPLDGDLVKKVLMVFQQNAEEKPNSLCMNVSELSDRIGLPIVEVSACLKQLAVMGMVQNVSDDNKEFKWAIAPEVLPTISMEFN